MTTADHCHHLRLCRRTTILLLPVLLLLLLLLSTTTTTTTALKLSGLTSSSSKGGGGGGSSAVRKQVNTTIFRNTSVCHSKSDPNSLIQFNATTNNNSISSLDDCLRVAIHYSRRKDGGKQQQKCQSVCWSKDDDDRGTNSTSSSCHCHIAPIWIPLFNETVDSILIDWPCNGPQDCSYNGKCSSSQNNNHNDQGGDSANNSICECFTGWGGVRCGELQLLPVNKSHIGFREREQQQQQQQDTTFSHHHHHHHDNYLGGGNNNNVSTWGCPILWDETSQKWHGWVSEIINHCGINVWNVNSQIVHITGDSPTGPFIRQEIVALPFAHEPSVKRGPNGEWVMLYSAYNNITRQYSTRHQGYDTTTSTNSSSNEEWNRVVCTNCSNGATRSPVQSKGCPFQRGQPQQLNHPYIQMMSSASNPYGPWTNHTEIPALTTSWDWNTAFTIHPDDGGSALALIRGGYVWHAYQYSNPNSWHPVNGGGGGRGHQQQQSPPWSISIEDPFIWNDPYHYPNVYHALAHCLYTKPLVGVHAYAVLPDDFNYETDLLHWIVTGVAYTNIVNFTDGISFAFSRRERPQLIFGNNNNNTMTTTPVALSNGVAYGKDPFAVGQDMTFTLIQPIQQQQQQHEKVEDPEVERIAVVVDTT